MFNRMVLAALVATSMIAAAAVHAADSVFPRSPNETTPWHLMPDAAQSGTATARSRTDDRITADTRGANLSFQTASNHLVDRAGKNTSPFPFSPNETGVAW